MLVPVLSVHPNALHVQLWLLALAVQLASISTLLPAPFAPHLVLVAAHLGPPVCRVSQGTILMVSMPVLPALP